MSEVKENEKQNDPTKPERADRRVEFIVLGLLAILILVLATPLTGNIKTKSVGPNPELRSFEP